MPTGYTAAIEDGEITTGKDFLMRCARAFGVCIDLRDEPLSTPIPEKFEVDNYYYDSVRKAKEELAKYKAMTLEEAQKTLDQEHEREIISNIEGVARHKRIKRAYDNVLQEVVEWEPPTEEHVNLKEFAIDQISKSDQEYLISFYEKALEKPKKIVSEWLKGMIEFAQRAVESSEKRLADEEKRVAEKNEWVAQLRESFA